MTITSRGIAIALLFALPLGAEARPLFRSQSVSYYYAAPYVASYYYPAPYVASYYYYPAPYVASYYYPVPVVTAAYTPAVPVNVPVYSAPAPCPTPDPLTGPMPPASPVPAVSETPTSAKPVVTTTAAKVSSTVRVSFWNRSERDVTLHVDGQARVLARGRGLTLEMPREFAWKVNDRPEEKERVPEKEPSVEIMIRR